MADSNNIKTPVTKFLDLHHSEVKKWPLDHPREGLRLEAHQLNEPEKMEKSEPIKKKRRPCQEAGIFPIRTQHNNKVQPISTSLSGCIGGNKTFVQATNPISLSPGKKMGARPKALSFKTNSSATRAFASRLQHPSSGIQQSASSMDHYQLPDNCIPVTSKEKEKKSRIPVLIARVKQERTIKVGKRKQELIAALEKRKQEITEELISIGAELNHLYSYPSPETTPTMRKDVPKINSPFFISGSPMSLTPIVLNVSPAPLLNAAESKNVKCLYENYRSTCSYLRTPQRFGFKRRRRGTILLQLERLFQD